MLKETYQLIQKLKDEIPFRSISKIFIGFDNNLIIQTRFKKGEEYYLYFESLFEISSYKQLESDTIIIKNYINRIKDFYNNVGIDFMYL